MCQKCHEDSMINLNNSEAVLKLAEATSILSNLGANSAKEAVLRRLESLVELPERTTGEITPKNGVQVTDGGDIGMTSDTAARARTEQKQLEEARAVIAQFMGVHPDAIQLVIR